MEYSAMENFYQEDFFNIVQPAIDPFSMGNSEGTPGRSLHAYANASMEYEEAGLSTTKSKDKGKSKSEDPDSSPSSRPKKKRRSCKDPEPEYSALVREQQRRRQGKRTGQACDRCRLRKLKCDPGEEGCKACLDNKQPCKGTDRNTGRTSLRGELEKCKKIIESLEQEIWRSKDENSRITGQVDDYKKAIVDLERDFEEMKVENSDLRNQLDRINYQYQFEDFVNGGFLTDPAPSCPALLTPESQTLNFNFFENIWFPSTVPTDLDGLEPPNDSSSMDLSCQQ